MDLFCAFQPKRAMVREDLAVLDAVDDAEAEQLQRDAEAHVAAAVLALEVRLR